MRRSTTAKALKENLKELTSTKSSVKKSRGSLTRKTQTTKAKTTLTTSTKTGTSKAKSSTKITIVQARKKDLFPHMGIAHKFDQYYGEERMKEHIRKHKLKSHQYKAYVNYWWLKDQPKS